MNKFVVAGVSAMASICAFGVEFPDADGSGDLSKPSAWGDPFPGTADGIEIKPSSDATYTFAVDCEFGILTYSDGSAGNVVFDQAQYGENVPTVRLNGLSIRQHSRTIEFKGGKYDFKGSGGIGSATYDKNQNSATVLKLTNGCQIENVDTVKIGYNGYSTYNIEVSDASVLSGKVFAFQGWNIYTHKFTVTGGSKISFSSPSAGHYLDGGSPGSTSVNLFKGEGTTVAFGGSNATLDFGRGKESTLTIDDGAVMTTPTYFYVGSGSNAKNGRITVRGGAVLQHGYRMFVGRSGSTGGHVLEVLDGGTVRSSNGYLYIGEGCPNNTLVVSNGTVDCAEVYLGMDASTPNQTLIVRGADSTIKSGNSYGSIFVSPNGRLIVECDGVYRPQFGCFAYDKEYTSNCVVTVRNGGMLKGTARTGYYINLPNPGPKDNWIRVEEGGTFDGVVLSGRSTGGGICVSNGTVIAQAEIGVGDGDVGGWSGYGTNCTLLVQGNRASVAVTNGSITVKRASVLRIEVPEAGYADGYATVERPLVSASGNIALANGCSLELAGLAAAAAHFQKSGEQAEYVLLDAATLSGVSIPAEVPDGVKIVKRTTADGRQRLLAKIGKSGIVLIVR